MPPPPTDPLATLLARAQRDGDCLRLRQKWDYPRIEVQGSTRLAHRVAYDWAYGLPSGSVDVHHVCGVRDCVNPDHLRAVDRRRHRREAARRRWRGRAA